MKRECKHHGLTEHKHRKDGGWRCKQCAKEAVIKRRKTIKEKLIEYKGGVCERCGYEGTRCPEVMDFHHQDPTQKEFTLARTNISLDRQKKEVDKCMMLCCRCHREIHAGI